MKIEHKTVTTVKITYDEATAALKEYQKDMLNELWCSCAKEYSNLDFMYLLLGGTESDWFQDQIEKHGILWMDAIGASKIAEHVESYPNVFFTSEILDQCDKDTQFFICNEDHNGEFYGSMLDNKTILSNI